VRSTAGLAPPADGDHDDRVNRQERRWIYSVFDKTRLALAWTALPVMLILAFVASTLGGHTTPVWILIVGLLGLPFGIARTRQRLRIIRREAATAKRRPNPSSSRLDG